jgi:PAS domain-containing protein
MQDLRAETAYFLGIHRDVTAMHHLEQQVHYQKALIESMVDAAPAVIALLDENGRVILDNHEYKKLVGDLRVREPAAEFLRALRETLGETFRGAIERRARLSRPGGQLRSGRQSGQPRWFSCSGVWFREQDGSAATFFKPVRQTYLLLMANEITALKRQQEAVGMNAMRALLAEQERVRSMREALQAAIFQMQGPLNLIAAARDLLERRGAQGDPALRHALNQAAPTGQDGLGKAAGAGAGGAPGSGDAGQHQSVAARGAGTVQAAPAGGRHGRGLEARRRCCRPSPRGPAACAACSSSCSTTPWTPWKQSPPTARTAHRHRGSRAGGHWWSSSKTPGRALPRNCAGEIFEPFFTTKRAATHTGLGLALVAGSGQ